MDELDVLFERMCVRPPSWKFLGRLMQSGTGWFLRDPVFRDRDVDAPHAWPGCWVLHMRVRPVVEGLGSIQFQCLWEDIAHAPIWQPQPPLPLETGCLVLCDATRFRRDEQNKSQLLQYRGFYAEHEGDTWMLAGFHRLDHVCPRGDAPIPFALYDDSAWFQSEPIMVPWEVAVVEGRVGGLRWQLPLEGCATWDP